MRTFNPSIFNEVSNRPNVRPTLGGTGLVDFTNFARDPNNFMFTDGHGGFLYGKLAEGLYEVHTIFDPAEARPRAALEMAHKTLEYMFLRTDCVEVCTQVPDVNQGADALASRCGFQEQFRREGAWVGETGVSYRNLLLDRWAHSCSTNETEGASFHDLLEDAKNASESSLLTHPDDPAHDRIVGAAVRMLKAGNVVKGINFYNRWAVFAGYATVELVSHQPVVVDVRDAIVGINDGKLEVLQCRLGQA